ncbi:hypothetical protein ENUP19_0093G0029 [Entamoeba nuttalli]|uniref:Uncharacterized protein n=1 Tax=Entamoeba nuttalli TaxID=412467 RepID=A0ABQ0DH82_9EUKA
MNYHIYKKQTYYLRVNSLKRKPKYVNDSLIFQYNEIIDTSNEIIENLTLLKEDLLNINISIKEWERVDYINFIWDISKIIKIFYSINKTIISNDIYMLSQLVNDCLKIMTVDEDLWMKYPLMKFLSLYVIILFDNGDELVLENIEMITKLLNKWNQIQKRNNSNEEIDLSLLDLSEP